MPAATTIAMDKIKIDLSIDPRISEREDDRVKAYAECVASLPPILVDGDHRILDGIHRFLAHKEAGLESIKVEVIDTETEFDVLAATVRQNVRHGLGLTPMEGKMAAVRLWEADKSVADKVLAEIFGRTRQTILRWLSDVKAEWKQSLKEEVYRLAESGEFLHKNGNPNYSAIARVMKADGKSITKTTAKTYYEEQKAEYALAELPVVEAAPADLSDVPKATDEVPDKLLKPPPINVSDRVGASEPTEEVADAPPTDASAVRENIQPTHLEIQAILLELGREMGLDLWVAKDNQNDLYKGSTLSSRYDTLPSLPTQRYQGARRTIESIDVMWIKDGSIVAAFEVEHTTNIHSGLLRLSDLQFVNQSQLYSYVVANRQTDDRVRKEINRPTFKRIRLPEHCRYISYDMLINEHKKVKAGNSSTSNDWQQLLKEISEDMTK